MTTPTPSQAVPNEIKLGGHQILAFYHGLRLQVEGIIACRPAPTAKLNKMAKRRWSARQWLTVIEPHYERITGKKAEPLRKRTK